jgi:hypothetical protein
VRGGEWPHDGVGWGRGAGGRGAVRRGQVEECVWPARRGVEEEGCVEGFTFAVLPLLLGRCCPMPCRPVVPGSHRAS